MPRRIGAAANCGEWICTEKQAKNNPFVQPVQIYGPNPIFWGGQSLPYLKTKMPRKSWIFHWDLPLAKRYRYQWSSWKKNNIQNESGGAAPCLPVFCTVDSYDWHVYGFYFKRMRGKWLIEPQQEGCIWYYSLLFTSTWNIANLKRMTSLCFFGGAFF